MLDRVLVPLLVAATFVVAGVVGGDVVDWRLASAEAEQHTISLSRPGSAPAAPAPVWTPPASPAPVLTGPVLRLRPTRPPVTTPAPAAPTALPAVEQPLVARIPAPPALPTPETITITQANLYQGMSAAAFAQDLAAVTSTRPDFITLNEVGHRSTDQIQPTGYASYRATGSPYLAETPVLWRTERWSEVDAGSRWMTTRKVKWGERAVNWVTLQSATGQVVTVVSAHPAPTVSRTAGLLPVFVDRLGELVRELSARGPVLVGGDFNAGYGGPLYPAAGFAAAGLTPTYDAFGTPLGGTGDHGGHTIDYVLHTPGLAPVTQSTRELISDHDAVLATFRVG